MSDFSLFRFAFQLSSSLKVVAEWRLEGGTLGSWICLIETIKNSFENFLDTLLGEWDFDFMIWVCLFVLESILFVLYFECIFFLKSDIFLNDVHDLIDGF